MSLVKMRTAELIGPALDWAVAQIESETEHVQFSALPSSQHYYAPSRKWAQGGPLIAKYRVSLEDIGIGWIATPRCCTSAAGSMTPQASDSLLVAACRAIVCASIGDTVQIPSELFQ